MTVREVVRRLTGRAGPGRRPAPRPGEAAVPRGDHDLNPDLYEAQRALVPAAVLVPIVARAPGPTLLLTRRTEHLDVHAGQISFPGGRIEPGEGPEAAALRETEEEIGLPRQRVRVIGWLDAYVTRTGFEVAPVVGLVRPPVPLAPDPFEVAEVFEVPLAFILAPESRRRHRRIDQGRRREFYAFPYQGHYIWGATAGMLVNLVEVLSAESGPAGG